MTIQSVDALINAIKQQGTAANTVAELNKVDPVLWGPPTSLEGGDAAGRLGIDMGEPSVKAAAMRNLLMAYNQAEKEAALGAGLMTAGRAAAAKFGPRIGTAISKLNPVATSAATKAPKAVASAATKASGAAAEAATKTPSALTTAVKNIAAPAGTVAEVGSTGATAHQLSNLNRTRYARGMGIR